MPARSDVHSWLLCCHRVRDGADTEERASCIDRVKVVEGGHVEVGGGSAGEIGDLEGGRRSETISEETMVGAYCEQSHWQREKERRSEKGIAYPSAVHEVVYPAKLSHGGVDHVLHVAIFSNIGLYGDSSVFRMPSMILALTSSILCALYIEVCKEHTCHTSFSEGEGSFLADPSGGLEEV